MSIIKLMKLSSKSMMIWFHLKWIAIKRCLKTNLTLWLRMPTMIKNEQLLKTCDEPMKGNRKSKWKKKEEKLRKRNSNYKRLNEFFNFKCQVNNSIEHLFKKATSNLDISLTIQSRFLATERKKKSTEDQNFEKNTKKNSKAKCKNNERIKDRCGKSCLIEKDN